MAHITGADLHANLERTMDDVVETCASIIISRQDKPAVVMMSLLEFEGWQETVYLLSNPRNAEVLLRSIRDCEAGRVKEHALIWPPGI
jgi:antitoxin YefM